MSNLLDSVVESLGLDLSDFLIDGSFVESVTTTGSIKTKETQSDEKIACSGCGNEFSKGDVVEGRCYISIIQPKGHDSKLFLRHKHKLTHPKFPNTVVNVSVFEEISLNENLRKLRQAIVLKDWKGSGSSKLYIYDHCSERKLKVSLRLAAEGKVKVYGSYTETLSTLLTKLRDMEENDSITYEFLLRKNKGLFHGK